MTTTAGMERFRVGQPVPPVEMRPDEITLLRFGAITRNMHRIHYDTDFAASEGLEGLVVMAQLHGGLFHRAAAGFAGESGRVIEVGWQNRAPAYAGDRLEVTGTVCEIHPTSREVRLDLEERSQGSGTVCCRGRAVIVFP